MAIEQVQMTDRVSIPITKKLNPLWWLHGPDGWTVPDINNGEPYLPDVKNIWLRRFYWFVCRNSMMNFSGFILGVEDKNYEAVGPAPVLLTTLRDATPPRNGWKWAILWPPFSVGALIVTILFTALAVMVHWAFFLVVAFSLFKIIGPLPYVSYNGFVEAYLGWRPYSGGYGAKLVKHSH